MHLLSLTKEELLQRGEDPKRIQALFEVRDELYPLGILPNPPPDAPPPVPSGITATPTEILVQICRNPGTVELWNLAQAAPFRFLSQSFNIYWEEPLYQVLAQDNPPMVETDETRPLLLWAIENGVSPQVIRQIAEAYYVVHPQALNSIWGKVYRQLPTPLISAVRAGRPEVVDLLLNLGADPRCRYGEKPWREIAQGGCSRVGYPYTQCANDGGPTEFQVCDDAFLLALRILYSKSGQERRIASRCVEIFFEHGIKINLLQPTGNSTEEFRLVAGNGFFAEIKALIDEILNLPSDDPTRSFVSRNLIRLLWPLSLIQDGEGELIEYIVGLGTPIK